MEEAQSSIFNILINEKMSINSFNIITPTLEEIFVSEVLK